MHVLILGATGSIGSAILELLVQQGCAVSALSRSTDTASRILYAGATPLPGDIRRPAEWIDFLKHVDAVIHAAASWEDDMDVVDSALVTALIDALQTPDCSKALIYTGGCWLYGNTDNVVATEESPLCKIPGYQYSIETMQKVLTDTGVRGMVIHPAMVYERGGGVFERMYADIAKFGYPRVFGSLNVRWPLIHRHDLAKVYALMLSKAEAGDVFIAAAIEGVAVGEIAQAISASVNARVNEGTVSEPVVYDIEIAKRELGAWAEGFALDQLMSGQKARQVLGWLPEHEDVFEDIV